MKKYNQMFSLRSKKEFATFYKNPSIILSFVALAIVIACLWIPLYASTKDGSGMTFSLLLEKRFTVPVNNFVLAMTIAIITCSVISTVLSFLFKNSPKLSVVNIILGAAVLILAILEYLFLAKIGIDGMIIGLSPYIGSILLVVASLIIMGIEFYKLGWQGYDVKNKEVEIEAKIEKEIQKED